MDRLEALSRAECLELLSRGSLGRVAFTERALPAIRPLNYALVGNHLVLRTEADGLGRRLDGQIVAFEVDEIDAEQQTGWSVVVTGSARLLRNPGDLVRAEPVPLVPLAGNGHDACVYVIPGDITGRRIRPAYDAA
ncbi:MAG: pyridoxamine 5'-phosphate oxidase family protein [Frankiaceae bacterium]|nr:pyridoxamine 5'-phosphate oxidase family protein [Frankiaceae bacterium]